MACNDSNQPVNNNAVSQLNVEKIEVPELIEKNVVATEHDINQAALTTTVQGVVGVLHDIQENVKDMRKGGQQMMENMDNMHQEMQEQGNQMKEKVDDVQEQIRLMKEAQKRAAIGRVLKFALFTSLLVLFFLGVLFIGARKVNSDLHDKLKEVDEEKTNMEEELRQQLKDRELSERGWIFAFFVTLLVAVFSGILLVSMSWENSDLKKRI